MYSQATMASLAAEDCVSVAQCKLLQDSPTLPGEKRHCLISVTDATVSPVGSNDSTGRLEFTWKGCMCCHGGGRHPLRHPLICLPDNLRACNMCFHLPVLFYRFDWKAVGQTSQILSCWVSGLAHCRLLQAGPLLQNVTWSDL